MSASMTTNDTHEASAAKRARRRRRFPAVQDVTDKLADDAVVFEFANRHSLGVLSQCTGAQMVLAMRTGATDVVGSLLQHQLVRDVILKPSSDSGSAALHFACLHGMLATARLVAFYVSEAVHLTDNDGLTPLCIAVKHGHRDCAAMLLGMRADVNCRTATRATPLMLAAGFSGTDMIDLLVGHRANIRYRSVNDTAALAAVTNPDVSVLQCLLDMRAIPTGIPGRYSPLCIAATNGSYAHTKALLRSGGPRLLQHRHDECGHVMYSAAASSRIGSDPRRSEETLQCMRIIYGYVMHKRRAGARFLTWACRSGSASAVLVEPVEHAESTGPAVQSARRGTLSSLPLDIIRAVLAFAGDNVLETEYPAQVVKFAACRIALLPDADPRVLDQLQVWGAPPCFNASATARKVSFVRMARLTRPWCPNKTKSCPHVLCAARAITGDHSMCAQTLLRARCNPEDVVRVDCGNGLFSTRNAFAACVLSSNQHAVLVTRVLHAYGYTHFLCK